MKDIIESTTAADIIVIIVAIIGGLYSIYTNNRMKVFQEKWNQKQLDADLKAKARIEWIQKVRETTAELITAYYSVLNTMNSTEEIHSKYIIAREKSELLILFFGPEKRAIMVIKLILKNLKE